MFELNAANAKIANFNPRAEKHGNENKLAADIKIAINVGQAALAHFHPGLREILFREPSLGEQPGLIDGEKLTALNLPKLSYPLKFEEEFPGYELEVTKGLNLEDPLFFEDVTLKSFQITPIEGGSVALQFNAIVHPDEEEAGLLCGLIQSEVEITLTPPSKVKSAQGDLLDTAAEPANDQIQQAADALERDAA